MSDEAMSPSTAGQNAETSSLASQVVASPGSIWGWSFNHAEDEPGLAELVAEGRLTELLWKTMNKRTSAIKTTLPPKPRPVLLSMPIPPPAISELRLTLERHLPALWHDRMHHLWAAGRNFTIESKIPFPNGQFITLQGRHWSQMDISGRPPSKILIIVNGRTETFLRYREDLHDALSMGWDVWMYDHRGQGVNTARMCSRPHLGTINSYQEYDDDFDQVLTEVILPWREAMDYEHIPIVMRGHSLGGVIAIRAAMRHPDVFQRVALTSPAVRLRSRGVGYRLFDFLNRWQGSVCDTLPWYYEPPKVELTVDYYRTCTMTSYTRFLMQFEAVLKYDDPSRMISGASYRWLSEIKRIGDDLTALPGETDGEVSGSAAAASIWLTKAELNPSPKTKNLIPEDRLYQNEVLKTPTFVAYDLLDEVIDPEGQKALKRKYPDMIRLSEFRGLHHQMWSAADIHRVPLMYQIYEFLKSDSPRP
ncbi:hypothetical protein CXG81DRAFT_25123 [Caulochytrium protostelioides]|nr:hypothetical protein CXG81DRAFT_25123 [Caulochytrium protostelioides]|eukprot:RKP02260.1 hypothetical protein CXG81DRAFT_25123 [Caulochytrium protostelioides]